MAVSPIMTPVMPTAISYQVAHAATVPVTSEEKRRGYFHCDWVKH